MNAKQELIDHIEDREVIYVQVIFEPSHFKNKKTIQGTLEEVLPKLNFDYDNNYCRQYIDGTIWYSDGTWSDRGEYGEYDVSEWWEHRKCPPLPARVTYTLTPDELRNEYALW